MDDLNLNKTILKNEIEVLEKKTNTLKVMYDLGMCLDCAEHDKEVERLKEQIVELEKDVEKLKTKNWRGAGRPKKKGAV